MIGVIAAIAAVSAFNPLHAAEPADATTLADARTMAMVTQLQPEPPGPDADSATAAAATPAAVAKVPGTTAGTEIVTTVATAASAPVATAAGARVATAAGATAATAASAADRLRNDPLQMAPVPTAPAVTPLPPVKLSRDERAIARYIASSYRIANESIERFVHYAFKAAREFRLDPHLILAVMAVESSFNPEAQSTAGAQGLMQVLTRVHTSKFEPFGGPEAAYDPLANIKVGARILSEYVKRYGDVAGALKAYVGAALLDSDGGYASKVMSRQAEFDAALRPKPAASLQAQAEDVAASGTVAVSAKSSAGL